MNKVYVGIDPGKDGGIVALNHYGEIICKEVMPTLGTTKRVYHPQKIKNILQSLSPTHVGIENPSGMEGMSKIAVASLTGCIHLFEGICVGLDIPHSLIHPKTWQSLVFSGQKRVTYRYEGKERLDTKATSLLVSSKIFPQETFLHSTRARVPHSGLVDSSLISFYVKSKFG